MLSSFSCPVLIGRDDELSRLLELVESARRGFGGAVLISGEAGIGKTRLVQEVCGRAESSGCLVLTGLCTEEGRHMQYEAVADALRGQFRRLDGKEIQQIGARFPELGRIEPELGGARSSPGTSVDQNRLSEALLRCLLEMAERRPLLLAIEDIHWADAGSLFALRYLAQRLRNVPVLLLITYRSDELGLDGSASGFVAEMVNRRLVQESIELRPLTWAQVRKMVRAIKGSTAPVRTSLIDQLYSRAEGNPLFTEAILHSLSEEPAGGGEGDGGLPAPLAVLLRRRIQKLSGDARQVLVLSSVIGRRFQFQVLARVTGRGDQSLLDALRESVDNHLLADRGDTYEFRHRLIQEAAAGFLLSPERRHWHGVVGETLETMAGEGAKVPVSTLAHHYDRAGATERVRDLAERAGDEARSSGAPREAGYWYSRALEAANDLGESTPLALLEKAADSWREAGHYRSAAEAQAQIAEAHQDRGDRVAEGEALAQQARLMWHDGDRSTAVRLQESALSVLERSGEKVALTRAYAGLANLYLTAFRGAEAYDLAHRAHDMAREVGAADVEVHALRMMGSVLAAGPKPESGKALLQEAVERAAKEGDPFEASVGFGNLVNACIKDADWTAGDRAARDGIRFCREKGMKTREGWIASRLAEIYRLTGRWDESEKLAEEAERLLDQESGQDWIIVHVVRCGLLEARGRWQEAHELLTAALPVAERAGEFQSLGMVLYLLAQAADALGDRDEAVRRTEQALELWRSTTDTSLGLPLLTFACRLFVGVDRIEAARACREDLAIVHDRVRTPIVAAHLAAASATLAEAEGSGEAADLWSEAESVWSRLGRPYDAAVASFGHGRTLLQRGDRETARAKLQEAQERFAALGAFETEEVDGLLRRSRLVAPPSRRAGRNLSQREKEVVALVARGLTNRRIAEELYLSEKTVEKHVGRVLDKLQLESRTQVAAYAVEHALADSPDS